LKEHDGSLQTYPPFPTSRLIPDGFLRNMNDSAHDRFAPILRRAFLRIDSEQANHEIALSVRRALENMAEQSLNNSKKGILPTPYLRTMAFEILARLLFGFTAGSQAQCRLVAEFERLDINSIKRWSSKASDHRRWQETIAFLESSCRLDRDDQPELANHDANLLAHALALAAALDDEELPSGATPDRNRETLIGNVIQMQESGTNDLSGLLTWVLKHLGDNPAWLRQLQDDLDPDQEPSSTVEPLLAELVVRESLRLEQSEYLYRRTRCDIHFRGFLLPKGWLVRMCTREAHRRSDIFEQPITFNPDRFLNDGHSTMTHYAPFGLYRHRCVAARLVLTIGRIFVDELARSYLLEIASDGPPEHRRFHWQPSPQFRVRILPQTA
jgi:cytochrome P450